MAARVWIVLLAVASMSLLSFWALVMRTQIASRQSPTSQAVSASLAEPRQNHPQSKREPAHTLPTRLDPIEPKIGMAAGNGSVERKGKPPGDVTQETASNHTTKRSKRYKGLRSWREQLPLSSVKSKPYQFWKDVNGFCHLEGFELSGPLVPKGPRFPTGLRYEDFLKFNGTQDALGKWHKLNFHVVSNDRLVFIVAPKSGSTSTRNFLGTLGKRTGGPLKLRFALPQWWKKVETGNETRGFLEWFFSPEVHGNKHFFTTIREPYSRLDSGTGTVLNRWHSLKRKKERLGEVYSLGFFHEALVHIYPQSYFYSHTRNLTVFRVGPSYGPQLNKWLTTLFPGHSFSTSINSKANVKEGKNVDRNLTQHLLDTGRHDFLRDYIFDEMLWERASELQC